MQKKKNPKKFGKRHELEATPPASSGLRGKRTRLFPHEGMPPSGQRDSLLAQRQLGSDPRHGAEGGRPPPPSSSPSSLLPSPSLLPPPSSPLGVVPEGALSSPPDHSKVPSRLDDTREKTTLREGQRDAGRQGVGWRRARAAGGVSGAAEPLRPRTSGCSHKRAALRGRKGEWPVCASP